MIFLATRIQ